MKLRHKASGVVIEGCFMQKESGKWVNETLEWGERSLYDPNEWERVPEERWVQVPVDLSNCGRSVRIQNVCGDNYTFTLPPGYRWLDGGVIVQRKEYCS